MPRTELTRLAEKATTDRVALDTFLDSQFVAHVGLVADDHPVVIPTAFARDGDRVLVHGSTGSRWMRALADGVPASVAVTAVDGIVVARSAFESSIRYRSAVLFGRFTALEGEEKIEALARLTDSLIPGRRDEVRPSSTKEYAATLVLQMPISEWSFKVSAGWPEDEESDVAGDAWAGVVPMGVTYGAPIPAPDLRRGIELPPSVLALSRR